MKYRKEVYEVEVELRIKAKVLTSADSESEAYQNVQDDYENHSLEQFLSDYDWEAKDFDMDYATIKDEPM